MYSSRALDFDFSCKGRIRQTPHLAQEAAGGGDGKATSVQGEGGEATGSGRRGGDAARGGGSNKGREEGAGVADLSAARIGEEEDLGGGEEAWPGGRIDAGEEEEAAERSGDGEGEAGQIREAVAASLQ
ncbi:UNVERIFIED_CONTAM: hypothetical protein Sangu_2891200 [Sesamum angustifolium]|uniref:Uncharacterized protein n=1 Tax=Sesamum angustifolium TaxID=2727405 RepID=A0AAW2IM76_9LAMI